MNIHVIFVFLDYGGASKYENVSCTIVDITEEVHKLMANKTIV